MILWNGLYLESTMGIISETFIKILKKMFDIVINLRYYNIRDAEVSELADEQDSGSCERYAREGSSPFFRIQGVWTL